MDGGWQTESVHLVEPDPGWERSAEVFAAEVRAVFDAWLVDDVQHVGSTAVPGLLAKPVVDLQVSAADPAVAVAAVSSSAASAGWMFVPRGLDRRPWRWFFVRVSADERSRLAHLHLMAPGERRGRDQLVFRDRLRASSCLRAEYAAVKRRAANDHPDDREAYTGAKTDFVARVVEGVPSGI